MCDSEGHHPDNTKILKIVEWLPCASIAEAKMFIEVCMYYQIWIAEFAHITASIYYLFQDEVSFKWVKCQQEVMNLLKKWLMTASALKSIDYHEDADDIVLAVDTNDYKWGTVLIQCAAESNWKWHPIRYESGVWSLQKAVYDTGWRKCRGVLLALKKLQFWLYKVHFVFEVDMNTLVAQLNQAAINLPEALVIWWMVWIKLFDFSIKYVPGKKHSAADDLSQKSENLLSNEKTNTVNDFIDLQLNSIQICSVSVEKSLKSAVLKNDYSEELIRIAVFFISLQQLLNLTTKKFQKFKKEALKYVISN